MFGIDFYPTPVDVIEKMLMAVPVSGKVVLEPSAGHGNIVKYCKDAGAKDVIACEIDHNLRKILSAKCHIIENDFLDLTAEKISHVDLIIMNPPFMADEKHILHAWDIAPKGCQIISLCNYSLIRNNYSSSRKQISELTNSFGRSDSFGKCFDTAERKTNVDIGCIWLHKPGTGENEFDGYFDLYDYEQEEVNSSGLVRYDFVQDIVSRYVEAVSMFDEVEATNSRMSSAISGVTQHFSIKFGATYTSNGSHGSIDRQIFKKELQKSAWNRLFNLMKMDKYITTGVKADINKFVEQQVHVPFTVRNVYLMIQMIAGTHGQRMEKVLVEAFEKICSFSYENCSAGEGWRTNTDFLINKKFILPRMTEMGWHGELKVEYSKCNETDDIVKALCQLTGQNFDDHIPISQWFSSPFKIKCDGKILTGYDNCTSNGNDWSFNNKVKALKEAGHEVEVFKVQNGWGEWIEWGFFKVKAFKKGTMHFEFIDEELWRKFNQRVAEIKGWKNMVVHTKKGRASKK